MDVTRHHSDNRGAYRVPVDGTDKVAELTWVARGGTRIANHTFVPPEARGQGLAQKLVEALIADARSEGFKIEPACSYVHAQFKRHPEWADLLADSGAD